MVASPPSENQILNFPLTAFDEKPENVTKNINFRGIVRRRLNEAPEKRHDYKLPFNYCFSIILYHVLSI